MDIIVLLFRVAENFITIVPKIIIYTQFVSLWEKSLCGACFIELVATLVHTVV